MFLGLICLGFLAVIALFAKVASLLMKKGQDLPSNFMQFPPPEDATTVSSGPSADGDRPQRTIYKGLGVVVCAFTGAILGGVLIWPVVIIGSLGAFLFADSDQSLVITAIGAIVGAILGAVVGVALAVSAGRKPPQNPAVNHGE
jgi:hypothetical protein